MLRVQTAARTIAGAVLAACAWGSSLHAGAVDSHAAHATQAAPAVRDESPATRAPRADTRARDQQAQWQKRFGDKVYRYLADADHRLVYATCLDETSHAEMQRMIAAQADQQGATLFDAPPEVEVFVAICKPADAQAVIGGSTTTEGMYEHPLRRLIASDIGIVLRHEMTHLMHFGHMERLGQPHLIWVQEGLASLYESYDLDADGAIVFQPNVRHNQARLLCSSKSFMPLAKLVTLSPEDFMAKSQQLYPQVRSLFEYIADSGKLRRWYRRYTETFDTDRTGKLALEEVLGKPLAQIENDWRTWVLKRPATTATPNHGGKTVGVEVVAATDGVQVRKVDRRGAGARAGLKAGDVVTAVNASPVRSPREFNAAVAAVKGERAIMTVRRGADRIEISVEFFAPNPGARSGVMNHVVPMDACLARHPAAEFFFGPSKAAKDLGPCRSPSAQSTWT